MTSVSHKAARNPSDCCSDEAVAHGDRNGGGKGLRRRHPKCRPVAFRQKPDRSVRCLAHVADAGGLGRLDAGLGIPWPGSRRAISLLMQTDMSVINVALACGFASPSHFSKCYRAHYSTTPYRERGTQGAPSTPRLSI